MPGLRHLLSTPQNQTTNTQLHPLHRSSFLQSIPAAVWIAIYARTDVRDVHSRSSLPLQRAMTIIPLLVCLLVLSFVFLITELLRALRSDACRFSLLFYERNIYDREYYAHYSRRFRSYPAQTSCLNELDATTVCLTRISLTLRQHGFYHRAIAAVF
jgi:hypothetical protein